MVQDMAAWGSLAPREGSLAPREGISLDGDDGGCYQLSSGSLDWTLRYSVAVVGALEEEAAWGMVDSSLDGGRTQGHCADHLEGERERE